MRNSSSVVIKSQVISKGTYVIVCNKELKHFRDGKANLHIATSYNVECLDSDGQTMPGSINRYWITTKVKALKYFKILTSTSLDALQLHNAIQSLDWDQYV